MEEYKLYDLQVMTKSRIGTRGIHVLAPGRNPEEAKQDYLGKYSTEKGTDRSIARIKEVRVEGFKITLERIV